MSDRSPDAHTWQGFPRADGARGIRNHVVVAHTVYCAEHVARRIADPFGDRGVQRIGFDQCYPSDYGFHVMERLATHPNVGGVLLVSLGCEEFPRAALKEAVAASGRLLGSVTIQEAGGTAKSIAAGRQWVEEALARLHDAPRAPMGPADLVVGLECGGSDGFSGITANPATGLFADRLIDAGGTVIFEETNELFGCQGHLAGRACSPEVGRRAAAAIDKAVAYYTRLEHGSFGGGNITGGLSTIEEKSAGAYAKSGHRPLAGVLTPGEKPPGPGLYLLDNVYDAQDLRYGIPNIHDPHTVTTLAACGCHLVVFTTGCGSVVGQAVAPVIKVCSNTATYRAMEDDMDVNAGSILDGDAGPEGVAADIFSAVVRAAAGRPSRSEALGHQESHVSDGWFKPRACAARGAGK